MPLPHLKKPEDQRQSPRHALARLAKVQPAGGGKPAYYCLITDISGGGVRLHPLGFEVPDEFVLSLAGYGPARDGTYKVIWRLGSDVGAKLMEPTAHDI